MKNSGISMITVVTMETTFILEIFILIDFVILFQSRTTINIIQTVSCEILIQWSENKLGDLADMYKNINFLFSRLFFLHWHFLIIPWAIEILKSYFVFVEVDTPRDQSYTFHLFSEGNCSQQTNSSIIYSIDTLYIILFCR